ncbi:MAG: SpoIIE family protein phosphatase [Lachnospiraceae bacterium]|nr:SpoIIE family protein phosphatase [Lachnospiraceae bacterium]
MRSKGLEKRIVLTLVILMLLMAVIILIISTNSLKNNYYKLYTEKAQDIVRVIAREVDGDWIGEFINTYDKDSEEYERTKYMLDTIKDSFTGIQYLYIFKPEETGFTYLLEAVSGKDDLANINQTGDFYEFTENDYNKIVVDIKEQKASDRIMKGVDVGYGETISAWAPIFDSQGTLVAMVEADYVLSDLKPDMDKHMKRLTYLQLTSILMVVFLMLVAIRRIIIEPVNYLKKTVDSYEHGVLDNDLSYFKNDDEIKWLAISFKSMTERIEKYIKDLTEVTAEKERIGAELNVATQIQADMLPRIFPPFPDKNEFELFATMNPAKEVGGDFYDFFMIDDDHLGLVMADVSGKGVPAALFMVIAKTLIKNRAITGNFSGPGEVLADANNQLCEGNDAELFVTVWFGILTISTGHITFASAGHEYPAFYRLEEGFRLEKDKHGMPLATLEDLRFRENETQLKEGEILYLYTDGVTEATNGAKELFGEGRMISSLQKHHDNDMENLLKNVRKDIDEFVGDAPQFDDITMLGIKYNGSNK